jgi:hypothetical protein
MKNYVNTVRIYLIIIFLSFSSFVLAQDDLLPLNSKPTEEAPTSKKQYFLLSPRFSVTVPHPMGNKSFKKSFVGIYEVSGGLNLMLYKGFFIGVTAKNGLFKITENKIADYNANMNFNNVAVKVGNDFYVGEKNKAIYSMALSVGNNWTEYSGIKTKEPKNPPKYNSFTTYFIEPEMNIFFLIESNFGIGATLSYTVFDTHFDPYDLALNEYAEFDRNNAVSSQFISFGFGFYYSFIPKKK